MARPDESSDYGDELREAGEPYLEGLDEDGQEIYSNDFYDTEAGEELMYEQMLAERDD
jgi:hypothetical protein